MTGSELMLEGINLMFAGMGFVILFLFLLIYAVGFSSKLINRYFPEPITTPPSAPNSSTDKDNLEQLRPIIVAAIAHHRRQQSLK
ncbi:oxaloacetate decarboxylase subunit gamma [Rodentibacter haemolyticus]|uniref:Probable oxaloacetate decarboxylase gamma chain n=1 Tax=Rodentibacter haemolyticus TaxID=2778911 RepID=A0ABX6UZY8_9PAST|nr:oxaloacetate decarboxylase subunit gamma [Rodentibacter haemolyticus]QPB43573.1 oxaloacetate decarboxylase subunit gamma [Rodentibacter haemolyticus]